MLTKLKELLIVLIFCFITCYAKWWEDLAKSYGPNVCVGEQVIGESRYFAYPWADGNICGKPTAIKLHCCKGYDMVKGEKGCSLVKPLRNIIETVKAAGTKEFINRTEEAGLVPLLSERGAFTVFAPTDRAFRPLPAEAERMLRPNPRQRERSSVLLYSVVESRILQEDLAERPQLNTQYRDGALRVIKHANGAVTLNCVPLVAANLEATNGIVHLTESLLLPPSHSSVLGLLAKEKTLSALYAAVVRTQLSSELRSRGPFTLFAPVDQAWESLPQNFTETLNGNSENLKTLLRYHIVEGVWCASMAAHESEILTMEGTSIKMTCNGSGTYLNDATILRKDKMVGNGVIQFIDKVLIPDKVKTLSDIAEDMGLITFLRFVSLSALSVAMKGEGSYTMFVPTDEAFNTLENTQWDLLTSDPSYTRSIISYHMTAGAQLTANMIDGQMIPTLAGPSKLLRVKMQRKNVGEVCRDVPGGQQQSIAVDAASITSGDHVVRNGILHVIDRVLLPTELTLSDMLQEGNYSGFVAALNQTSPNMLTLLSNQSNTFTVFAPDDDALIELPRGTMARLLADSALLTKVVGNHIIDDYVTVNGLQQKMYYQYRTISDRPLTLRKEDSNVVTVGNLAAIKERDIVARNGILHRISRLIQF